MIKRIIVVAVVMSGCGDGEGVSGTLSETEQEIHRGGRVTICHKKQHTIRVPRSALRAHRAHGDTLGRCRPPDNDVCTPGSTLSCYDGPAGTEDIGTCRGGTQRCNADGTGYGACEGSVVPVPDVCGDGLDNDCDGVPDESCVCTPNSTASCYDGPDGTEGVGTCVFGTQVCNADGSGFGECEGSVGPITELCGDALDNDCDGAADDGCVCTPNSSAPCYDGPSGTEGVGTCVHGTQVCNEDGTNYGACQGAVTPVDEICSDGLDNDCDGVPDDSCVCVPSSTAPCYDGPDGTEGVGTCSAGTQLCNGTGTGYGECTGSVTPTPDVCSDGLDNDCDGVVDGAPNCFPESNCQDGIDDDLDGAVDCADDDCAAAPVCQPEVCTNDADDDADGLVDCNDPDCSTQSICTTEANCGDGADDDADGLTDCAEPGCALDAACLTPIEFYCNDGVDNDGDGLVDSSEAACAWAVTALPCAPGKLQVYRFTGPTVIPDPGTLTVNLVASGPGTVGTVAVRLNVTHTFLADVDIRLVSAQNTNLDVSTDNGGTADNYVNTVLIDSAPTPVAAGAAPFTGSFRPEQAFSTLTGQTVTGTWRGLVADDTAGFQGTISEYSLAICIQ